MWIDWFYNIKVRNIIQVESLIDQKYRMFLLSSYLNNPLEVQLHNRTSKWIFSCPFCANSERTEARRNHRKAALLWNDKQHSWVFCCAKRGSTECQKSKSFPNLIQALNSSLFLEYQNERFHSGTTGKGHNCSHPAWYYLNKNEELLQFNEYSKAQSNLFQEVSTENSKIS